jgi:hypothetical protein
LTHDDMSVDDMSERELAWRVRAETAEHDLAKAALTEADLVRQLVKVKADLAETTPIRDEQERQAIEAVRRALVLVQQNPPAAITLEVEISSDRRGAVRVRATAHGVPATLLVGRT